MRHLIVTELGYLYRDLGNTDRAITCFKDGFTNYPNKYKGIRDSILAGLELVKILISLDKLPEAKKIIEDGIEKRMNRIRHEPEIRDRYESLKSLANGKVKFLAGVIISANAEKRYVIIEASKTSGDTFLGHYREFHNPDLVINSLLTGQRVRFIQAARKDGNRDRKDALSITFIEQEG